MKIFKNIITKKCRINRHKLIYNSITRKRFGEVRTERGNAISMQGNLQHYKHREQDKTEEISPLVDAQSHYYAEKDKRIKKTLSVNKE